MVQLCLEGAEIIEVSYDKKIKLDPVLDAVVSAQIFPSGW